MCTILGTPCIKLYWLMWTIKHLWNISNSLRFVVTLFSCLQQDTDSLDMRMSPLHWPCQALCSFMSTGLAIRNLLLTVTKSASLTTIELQIIIIFTCFNPGDAVRCAVQVDTGVNNDSWIIGIPKAGGQWSCGVDIKSNRPKFNYLLQKLVINAIVGR